VTRLADVPGESVAEALAHLGLDGEPAGWRERLPRWVAQAEGEAYDRDPGRVLRHAAGKAMASLRGRVPAAVVLPAVKAALEPAR
jgi:hypothetical protein